MYDYYCKNCNNIVGKWYCYDKNNKFYEMVNFCIFRDSKNFESINFLDCIHCKKFIGISYYYVCKTCFGEDEIFGEENLFNLFFKYKKIITSRLHLDINNFCKVCNTKKFRLQYWFFGELTFYKK